MKTIKAKQAKAPWTRMRGGIKPRSKAMRAKGKKIWRKLWPKIKKVSAAREKRNREYLKVRKEFLGTGETRQACNCSSIIVFGLGFICGSKVHLATDVHHSRGRAGSLLTDKRFFIAVCREAHRWIGENPEAARALGLLCAKGQWNKPVK